MNQENSKPLALSIMDKILKELYFIVKLFIGIVIFFATLAAIAAVYFMILLYTGERSFPALDKYVELSLSNISGFSVKIEETKLGLNNSWDLVVNANEITLSENDTEVINLPRVLVEFRIVDLLIANFQPSMIKIANPTIFVSIDENGNYVLSINDPGKKVATAKQMNKDEYLERIFAFEELIRNNKIPANFGMNSATFIFLDENDGNGNRKYKYVIKVPEASFRTNRKIIGNVSVNLYAEVNFDDKDSDLILNSSCKLSSEEKIGCLLSVANFRPEAIAAVFKGNNFVNDYFKTFKGVFDSSIEFSLKKDEGIENLIAKASCENGSFYYPKLFSKKIDFQNMKLDILAEDNFNLFEIKSLSAQFNSAYFLMSMNAKKHEGYSDIELNFDTSDVYFDDLNKLWPLFLNQNGIRDWVISHISGGVVDKAHAYMNLKYVDSENDTYLQKIESKVHFSNSILNYDNSFPSIKNINGVASFSEKEMNISIESGEVLGNKISDANVIIPDFNEMPYSYLVINGKLLGRFGDILQHFVYDKSNSQLIEDFVGGQANTKLYISLPLREDLSLKDVKINLLSNVVGDSSKYIRNDSNFSFLIDKKTNDSNMVINANFDDAEVYIPFIGLYKEKGKSGEVNINLTAEPNKNMEIKNLDIIGDGISIKSSGELSEDGKDVLSLKTQEIKYGHNDFNVAYSNLNLKNENINNLIKIDVVGNAIDLRPLINFDKQSDNNNSKKKSKNNKTQLIFSANINQIILENNEKISGFRANIEHTDHAFVSASVLGNIKDDKTVSLVIKDQPSKDFENHKTVYGEVNDIGSLAKGFNLYDRMIGGKGWIGGDSYTLNGKQIIEGKIVVEDEFDIIKSDTLSKKFLEKLPDIDVLRDEKEKLSKEKIIKFKDLKSYFTLKDNILEIKDMRFHGSNFGLGITVNGKIYPTTSAIALEGLIVPVYRLNSLPLIKDIPVVGKILVGEKGGGLFALRYTYNKAADQKEGKFEINPISAITPGFIRNVFGIFDGDDDKEDKKK